MARILLVDDDDLVREIAYRMLLAQGHIVHTAATGAEALRLLKSDLAFDWLLTDVMMPGGMNGIELANAARALLSCLRIILVTGNISQDVFQTSQPVENYPILQKPYRKQQLIALFAD